MFIFASLIIDKSHPLMDIISMSPLHINNLCAIL